MHLNPRLSGLLSTIVALVFAITTFYAVLVTSWAITGPSNGAFGFEVPVALQPTNELLHTSHVYISLQNALIESADPLIVPRLLTGVATALPFLIVMVGCVGAFVLLRRLSKQRPFSGAVQWLLGLLSILTILSAAIIPWFHSLAATVALHELGLPTDGTRVTENDPWFVERHFTLLQGLDWPLVALGVVLLLITLLWPHAVRMQRETEGLI